MTQKFKDYEKADREGFEKFKEEILKSWDTFLSNSRKEFVDYSAGRDTRNYVNFEEGKIKVEILVDPKLKKEEQEAQIQQKLTTSISSLINAEDKDNNKFMKGQVEKNGEVIADPKALAEKIVAQKDYKEEEMTPKLAEDKEKDKKLKVTVEMTLVPNHLEKRAKIYLEHAKSQSEKYDVDLPVVFAIIQTESYFNPKARSPIPAYGLMQLVPSSGGRDAWNYAYKEDKLVTRNELYVPDQNILLGTAYFSKIRHVYFKKVKNEKSAYYCSIAAYNTGIGNVCKTFTGEMKISPAVEKINTMTPDEVYNTLLKKLPYDETKDYLKKVTSRVENYLAWNNNGSVLR